MKKLIFFALALNLSAQITSIPSSGGGGGTPGGSNNQFQFNNAGAFAGSSALVLNADGSINVVGKAFTFAAPSTPTWNNAGTTTCDFSASNTCKIAMVGNQSTTLAFSNTHGASLYIIKFIQDATGGATIAYPGAVISAPNPTLAANDETDVACIYDGSTSYLCFQSGGNQAWHGMLAPEGSAIPGLANNDGFWADSTAHRWKFNNNNGSADTVVGASTTDTLTNKTIDTAGTGNHVQIGGHDLPTALGSANQALTVNGAGTALTFATVSGVTCDPFVLTNVCFPFDFSQISGGTANNTGVGAGGTTFFWINSSGSADTFSAVGSGTVPTGIQINSNAIANAYMGVMIGPQLSNSVNKFLPSSFVASAATMDFKFTTKLGTFAGVAGDNEKFFFGCTDGFPTNTNAFGVEYISGTDTQWTAVSINGGTATRTNIVAGDTNRHNLEIKKTSTANSLQMCVDATCATAITTNIPTAALNCGLAIQGTTTTTVTAVMYKGFMMLTGLTNP